MPTSGHARPAAIRLRVLTAALCAVIFLGLSLFVYSPLHRDDPGNGRVCPFCAFQHLGMEPAASPVHIAVSAHVFWLLAAATPATRCHSDRHVQFGRAPPPASFAI